MPIEQDFESIKREHILRAIEDIDRDGIPAGLDSRYYDLVFNGRSYPPKLVIAYAYKLLFHREIKTSEFNGGQDTKAFSILRREGFEIQDKAGPKLNELLSKFIRNSILIEKDRSKASLRVSDYNSQKYRGLEIRASFGKGNFSDVTWMGFLPHGQTIQQGVNPVILYSRTRRENNLEVCFGVSETEPPPTPWNPDFLTGLGLSKSSKYSKSYVYSAFTINSEEDMISSFLGISTALNHVIDRFMEQFGAEISTKIELEGFFNVSKLFEPTNLAFYIQTLQNVVRKIKIDNEDKRVVFSSKQNGLNFTVGQRYCLVLKKDGNTDQFGVITRHSITKSSDAFNGTPTAYYTQLTSAAEVSKHLLDIEEKIGEELARTTFSGFTKHDDIVFRNAVFKTSRFTRAESSPMNKRIELESLNTIFYGPPGTGKTKLATDLINQFQHDYKVKESVNVDSFIQDLPWWQVFVLVMHDLGGKGIPVSEIAKHKFTQSKLSKSNNKSLMNTIWGQLQTHTSPDSPLVNTQRDKRMEPFVFDKDQDSKWSLTPNWQTDLPELLEEFAAAKQNHSSIVNNTKFVTFHQSYSYEDFIEGIRPVNDNGILTYKTVSGAFKAFCDKARLDKDNKYLFVIDEINRGNISKIFGEFITLIEDSKREGDKYCVPVELQYSKEPFTVPKNVYIVGTMNTADRSIALLDLALRRRFSFKPLYPDPSKIEDVASKDVGGVFRELNRRIRALLGDDYQIGHTYFMGLDNDLQKLKRAWFNKVLPLLFEYFYADFVRLRAVVPSFVHEEKVHIELEDEREKIIYRLKTIDDYKNDADFVADLIRLK